MIKIICACLLLSLAVGRQDEMNAFGQISTNYDIQPCNDDNRGDCNCGFGEIQTYVFWPGDYIRCIHTFIPEGIEDLPVLISFQGYGQGDLFPFSPPVDAARYYGYALISLGSTGPMDGAGGFGLEFPSDGIVNYDNPTPCSQEDSREYGFIEGTLDFIATSSSLDETRVFMEGFSQNSMFAAFASVCFADRVVGLWQGGSGLAKTFHAPITPGFQGQCSASDFSIYGNACCEDNFCDDCTWWPVYPKTCENKLIACIAAYTNDNIACGSDWYMYEAMVEEENDARLLSFQPVFPLGGHANPANEFSWIVGCLGIVDSCSQACEQSFLQCMTSNGVDEFAICEEELSLGNLLYCEVGCAPTIEMLKTSESPLINLSEGKFGSQVGLPIPPIPQPPNCFNDFGSFDDLPPFLWENKCDPPLGSGPATGLLDDCSDLSSVPSTAPSSSPSSMPTDVCVNSPLNLIVDGLSMTCDWITSNAICLCGQSGVSSHCPVTCGTCGAYACSDSDAQWLYGTFSASCEFVSNLPPTTIESACAISDIAVTCGETCDFCN